MIICYGTDWLNEIVPVQNPSLILKFPTPDPLDRFPSPTRGPKVVDAVKIK